MLLNILVEVKVKEKRAEPTSKDFAVGTRDTSSLGLSFVFESLKKFDRISFVVFPPRRWKCRFEVYTQQQTRDPVVSV